MNSRPRLLLAFLVDVSASLPSFEPGKHSMSSGGHSMKLFSRTPFHHMGYNSEVKQRRESTS